ncbi:MAG: 16S rRNA (uracil(1498)-N(3))-methyltransferase [Proteobacteria bacterium]|nr:16S rRNA (uracil(1498)-N(3))-methyltransferase [Pseudomonadota bacterium]MCH9757585.1 16S rRNA (uracil(1498)-N(3))-methyltransferase [Pseudomonadota bacterium]
MRPRLYLPTASNNCTLQLTMVQSRHLIKVLRMQIGDTLEVFDGNGNAYDAVICDNHKDNTQIQLGVRLPATLADQSREIHIGQVMCAPTKMDWAIEKMTELGVTSITPLIDDKTKYRVSEQHFKRWQRLLIAACEQCGRRTLPLLQATENISQWQPSGTLIVLSPWTSASLRSVNASLKEESITLLVGSESGLSDNVLQQMQQRGALFAHLGTRILRTETAALAALAKLLPE